MHSYYDMKRIIVKFRDPKKSTYEKWEILLTSL